MAAVKDEENDARDGVVKEVKETPVKQEEVDPNFVSKLDSATVLTAVECLLRVVEEAQKEKSSLLEENIPIQLQYNFKKIPQLKNKRLHARIPHTLVTDDTDVCLFVKDVHKGAEDQEDKRDFTPSVRHFKQIVEEAGVKKVEEIIPVIQLKREYHDFEMQRKLCDSFDLFLCDERISKFMPKLLGKNFYKKRKFPINVTLTGGNQVVTKSLKKALESVHGLVSGQGSSTSVTIGHTGMTSQQISENISAVVSHMITVIPGGWPNISGLYVTTTKTTSIPLYVSTTSADKVELPPDVKKEKRLIASGDPGLIGGDDDDDDDEEGEGMVHVFDDGSIKIEGVDDDDEDQENQVARKKRKKKNQDKPTTAPTPTPTTVNGETMTSSDPAKKRRRKKQKKGKKNIAKTDDQVQPTEQPKSDEKTPIEIEAAAAAKKKKKSPAKTNGNVPAVNNVIKTEKVASTKGPLSKKPRLN